MKTASEEQHGKNKHLKQSKSIGNILKTNSEGLSLSNLYHLGVQQHNKNMNTHKKHIRVKSFANSESIKLECRKMHHSQAKKSYLEKAAGDTAAPAIVVTPKLYNQKNNIQQDCRS